jgi:Subtilase family
VKRARRPAPRWAVWLACAPLLLGACAGPTARGDGGAPSAGTAPADSAWRTKYWGLEKISADVAWATGVTGRGVRVAVVDSGVLLNHADLQANLEIPGDANRCPASPTEAPDRPLDLNGHGTRVAGTIGGKQDGKAAVGVAWQARLVPYKILCQSGFNVERAREALRLAIARPVAIVNASWSELPDDAGIAALITGDGKNVLFVFAVPAGLTMAPAYGGAGNVLVTSSDRQDAIVEGAVPGGSPKAIAHIAAPRVGIRTADLGGAPEAADGATNNFQFASASAAFVSGCAALIKERNGALTAGEIKNLILGSATVSARARAQGWVEEGRCLNCGQAVIQARP